MKQRNRTRKIAIASLLIALAVVGSMFSFPIFGSKCAPIQHTINVLAAVILGPGWSVGIAFCASFLRNVFGLGSLMAFPGSMIGALCCSLVYKLSKKLWLTCVAEACGTGFLGGLFAYPVAKLLMGLSPTSYFVYIAPFLTSTILGSFLAYFLVLALQKNGVVKK